MKNKNILTSGSKVLLMLKKLNFNKCSRNVPVQNASPYQSVIINVSLLEISEHFVNNQNREFINVVNKLISTFIKTNQA